MFEHDAAWVIGDVESLTALRDALNAVIAGEKGTSSVESMVVDGEKFVTLVRLVDWVNIPYGKDKYFPLPYKYSINESAPYHLFDAETYKKDMNEPEFG
jgi:hypothetical protein